MGFFVKLLLKAGITLGVMFVGYKYILTGGFQMPGMPGITEGVEKGVTGLGNAVVQKDVTVYQWVDSNGQTHYGSTPPTGQGEYSKKEIKANTNLMNAFKTPQKEEEEKKDRSRVSTIGSIYSPGGMKNMMDNTKDASKEMSDRMAKQEEMLNELMGETRGSSK